MFLNMNAKIVITLKSFEKFSELNLPNQELKNSFISTSHENSVLASSSLRLISSIALPKKQTLFTVLRSPHIDKKSRDQFEYKIYKQFITFETEIHQIREKLYKLKCHEIPGVQMKIVFQTKTRLCFNNQ